MPSPLRWDSAHVLFPFRLNEGHTVYLERHICGRLFGEKFRHFHALGGWGELQNTVRQASRSVRPTSRQAGSSYEDTRFICWVADKNFWGVPSLHQACGWSEGRRPWCSLFLHSLWEGLRLALLPGAASWWTRWVAGIACLVCVCWFVLCCVVLFFFWRAMWRVEMNFKLFLFILHFQFILLETPVLLSVVASIHKTTQPHDLYNVAWPFLNPIIRRIRVTAYTHWRTSCNPEAYEWYMRPLAPLCVWLQILWTVSHTHMKILVTK